MEPGVGQLENPPMIQVDPRVSKSSSFAWERPRELNEDGAIRRSSFNEASYTYQF